MSGGCQSTEERFGLELIFHVYMLCSEKIVFKYVECIEVKANSQKGVEKAGWNFFFCMPAFQRKKHRVKPRYAVWSPSIIEQGGMMRRVSLDKPR